MYKMCCLVFGCCNSDGVVLLGIFLCSLELLEVFVCGNLADRQSGGADSLQNTILLTFIFKTENTVHKKHRISDYVIFDILKKKTVLYMCLRYFMYPPKENC